jgi:hypothetical protein
LCFSFSSKFQALWDLKPILIKKEETRVRICCNPIPNMGVLIWTVEITDKAMKIAKVNRVGMSFIQQLN